MSDYITVTWTGKGRAERNFVAKRSSGTNAFRVIAEASGPLVATGIADALEHNEKPAAPTDPGTGVATLDELRRRQGATR